MPVMGLTEIIFRLFAWARPLLWYYHRLGRMLEAVILQLQDDGYCLWLFDNPRARAWFEGVLVDAERCLEIAIACRVRELLGLPMPVRDKPGIGGFHRIHHPASLLRLAGRLDRLVDRYNAIERLARLRARRIRRDMEAAPVVIEADHRPAATISPASCSPDPANSSRPDPANPNPANFSAACAIRAPP